MIEYMIAIIYVGQVMGTVRKVEDGIVTLHNPRILRFLQNKNSGEVIIEYAELLGNPVEVDVPRSSFPMYTPLDPDLIAGYTRATGLFSVN